jgi:hypothetical protein
MIKTHPLFSLPGDENAKIWRYLDFTKFLHLLEKSSLAFCRSDCLIDKFEGSYPTGNIKERNIRYPAERIRSNSQPNDYPASSSHIIMGITFAEAIAAANEQYKKSTAINCWHINEHESVAMWKLYLKSDEGVAIQSTYKRLFDCLRTYDDQDSDVYIGKVKYIDYNKEFVPEKENIAPFIYKRKSFEHENELRAIISREPFEQNHQIGDMIDKSYDELVYIPVDLDVLIKEVRVSPTSADWFYELVKLVIDRYLPKKNVEKSDLAKDPLF